MTSCPEAISKDCAESQWIIKEAGFFFSFWLHPTWDWTYTLRVVGLLQPIEIHWRPDSRQVVLWSSTRLPVWETKRCGFDPWVGKIPWRSACQPSTVLLPGESHGQRSLVGTVHGVAESLTWLKWPQVHARAQARNTGKALLRLQLQQEQWEQVTGSLARSLARVRRVEGGQGRASCCLTWGEGRGVSKGLARGVAQMICPPLWWHGVQGSCSEPYYY